SMDIADVPEAPRNDLYELKERVKEVFMRVQEAWSEREPSYAESYVSQRLFYKHQRQIEDMLHKQEKNILKNINIIDVKIVEVAGGGNGLEPDGYGGGGRMKTIIRASMIDYVIDENTGRIVDGDEYAPDEFCEQWNFVYEDDGWIADEIISGG
ncbi:MAG TPA: TIM44-like domain-containing protein, partial [Candidatus Wallbacteria bacterium]|nr:TIM44-like domain-containing protein [Candidatus Wallbacteria bacterium]